MELKKKVPEVRFKGFSGEWEEKIIGALCKETFGGGTPSTSDPECWNGEIPWIQSSDLVEEKLSNILPRKWISGKGLSTSATKLVPENSIAIVTRVGVGKVAFIPFKYATSQDFLSLSKLTIDSWFAVFSIWNKLQSELYAVQGTSIKGITKEELLFKKINVPGDFAEQSRIGTWFQHLDQLITLHQKKYNKLTNIKKAMLEKMFPKNGADVPEIRFEGFEGKWEEKRLGEIAEFCRGKGMNKEAVVDNGSYKCVLYGHLYTTYGMVINDVIYSTNKFDNDMYLSRIGDVLIPCSDTTPTGLARATSIELDGVILGGDINILRPNKQIDGSFLSYNINSNRYKLLPLIKGTTVRHIDNSELKTVELYIAKDNREQKQIVQFFQKLDQLITLQQTQIDKLQNIKKACLEKMFV